MQLDVTFFGGIAGLMCANILSDPDLVSAAYATSDPTIVGGLFYGRWQMFVCAILVLIATTAWVGGLTLMLYIVFWLVDRARPDHGKLFYLKATGQFIGFGSLLQTPFVLPTPGIRDVGSDESAEEMPPVKITATSSTAKKPALDVGTSESEDESEEVKKSTPKKKATSSSTSPSQKKKNLPDKGTDDEESESESESSAPDQPPPPKKKSSKSDVKRSSKLKSSKEKEVKERKKKPKKEESTATEDE